MLDPASIDYVTQRFRLTRYNNWSYNKHWLTSRILIVGLTSSLQWRTRLSVSKELVSFDMAFLERNFHHGSILKISRATARKKQPLCTWT